MRLPNRTKRRLVTLAVAWAVSKSKTEAGESLISWILVFGSWVLAFNSCDLVLGIWCLSPPRGFLLSNRSLGKLGYASRWVFGTATVCLLLLPKIELPDMESQLEENLEMVFV